MGKFAEYHWGSSASAITPPSGAAIRADEAAGDAVFERRSCGTGTKGPRLADRALTATASPRHFLLVRRLISRPGQLTFYLCYAPEGRPATMTCFITIAGRRWPTEETFKTGKDVLGWDQSQVRNWDALCRHTALAALAQLRGIAIRNALCGLIELPPAGPGDGTNGADTAVNDADLRIPLGDAPVPAYHSQPRPHRLGLIRLSAAETARLARLAGDWAAGLLAPGRLAFRLRWSAWRSGTRAPPGGITTRPAWPRRPPDPRRPEGGDSMQPRPRKRTSRNVIPADQLVKP